MVSRDFGTVSWNLGTNNGDTARDHARSRQPRRLIVHTTVPVIDVAPFVSGSPEYFFHDKTDRHISGLRAIVFFRQPNCDAVIECLRGCCGPDNPPRYEPGTSGQHRLEKLLKGVGVAPQPVG